MASKAIILPFLLSGESKPAMTSAEAHRFVHDVLMYLQTLEHAADLRNRRPLVLHYQECWLSVCEACHGEDWLPSQSTVHTSTAVVPQREGERPRWFIDKYSRPLRRVVGRRSKTHAGRGRGDTYTINYDVLSCGHMVEDHSATCGTAPAKHRRCEECIPYGRQRTSNASREGIVVALGQARNPSNGTGKASRPHLCSALDTSP